MPALGTEERIPPAPAPRCVEASARASVAVRGLQVRGQQPGKERRQVSGPDRIAMAKGSFPVVIGVPAVLVAVVIAVTVPE
jgi:hypothetical protein